MNIAGYGISSYVLSYTGSARPLGLVVENVG